MHSIAAIPGDGIGVETVVVARRVLDTLAARDGFQRSWTEYDWGCTEQVADDVAARLQGDQTDG